MKILDIITKKRYRISQGFGENPQMYKQFGMKGHNGIDIACPIGTELFACFDGKIVLKNTGDKGYGLHIRIINDRYEAVYGHLSLANVKVGQYIQQGEKIGESGNSGFSTGAHLHIGIRERENENVINYNNGYYGYFDFINGPIMEEDKYKKWSQDSKLCNNDNWDKLMTKYEIIVTLNRFAKYLKNTYLED